MKGDAIRAKVLSVKIISNINDEMAKEIGVGPGHRSIGMLTVDIDDIGYTAIDEATKKSRCESYLC